MKGTWITEIPRENPTLEDILFAVNGMKIEKMFLKRTKRDKEGNVIACFTKKGGKIYERLCSIIYATLVLTEHEDIFADIQETLDEIANQEG